MTIKAIYGQSIIVGKNQSNDLCLAIKGGKNIHRARPKAGEAGLEHTLNTRRSRDILRASLGLASLSFRSSPIGLYM